MRTLKLISVLSLLIIFKTEARAASPGDTLLKSNLMNVELLAKLIGIPPIAKEIPIDKAQTLTQNRLKQAIDDGDQVKAMKFSNTLGLIFLRQNQVQKAFDIFTQSLGYAKTLND